MNNNNWKINRGVKLDIPDFYSEHNVDVSLDWVSLESFFKWHNLNEVRKFILLRQSLLELIVYCGKRSKLIFGELEEVTHKRVQR